jgi:hypothetical protein
VSILLYGRQEALPLSRAKLGADAVFRVLTRHVDADGAAYVAQTLLARTTTHGHLGGHQELLRLLPRQDWRLVNAVVWAWRAAMCPTETNVSLARAADAEARALEAA